MRDFLRFFFPATDREAIDPSSISVEDVDYHHAPVAGQPYPQSMKITFRMRDPARDPPQLQPLFPGTLAFLVDPSAEGELPRPDTVDLSSGYDDWPTSGTLVVEAPGLSKRRSAKALAIMGGIRDHLSELATVPTVVWYEGVTLTEEFLLDTLLERLRRELVYCGGKPATVGRKHESWPKHALCGFLRGCYRPKLRLGSRLADDQPEGADEDEVAQFPMPIVRRRPDTGLYQLIVTAAERMTKIHDGRTSQLAAITPRIAETDPASATNGAVPARLLYRAACAHLLDAPAYGAGWDAILGDWPDAPRYFAFRCTRTWQAQETKSVHLPRQVIRVRPASGGADLARQRLPAHGTFWLRQDPPSLSPPAVTVEFEGYMKWLDGWQENVWRIPASTVPIPYVLSTGWSPHLQLRLPMSQAIFSEGKVTGSGCTYLSMRRTLRALVDNRIAGGRLNYGPGRTHRITRQLIDDAWAGMSATSRLVRDNNPQPGLAGKVGNPELLPILEAFFPDSMDRDKVITRGYVAYYLWQSGFELFQNSKNRSYFSNDHVGRGGPGALVYLGLAEYHVDLARREGENADDYAHRIVQAMMVGLERGAILQRWEFHEDFENVKHRKFDPDKKRGWGHSLIFKKYLSGDRRGIEVIDQYGPGKRYVQGPKHAEKIAGKEVWIAANWRE